MFEVGKHEGVTEVSFQESRNLHGCESSPTGSAFCRFFAIHGKVDPQRLQSAAHRLALRHEALRTRFSRGEDGVYVREVLDGSDIQVACMHLPEASPEDPCVQDWTAGIAQRRYRPASYPLVHVDLVTLRGEHSILALSVADFLFDAASISLLIAELGVLYRESGSGNAVLPPLRYGLSDFVRSHNLWMQGTDYAGRLERLVDRICGHIAGSGGIEQLLFAPKSRDAFHIDTTLSQDSVRHIHAQVQSAGVSVATYLGVESVSGVARLRGTDGLFFTTSLANRHYPGMERMVGFIATTMPYFMDVSPDEPPVQRLRRWHMNFLGSMSNFGMMPILDIGNAVAQRHPGVPTGGALKFGKVTINVRQPFEVPRFGFDAHELPAETLMPTSNEYNFAYETRGDGAISLHLKGLAANREHAEAFVARMAVAADDIVAA